MTAAPRPAVRASSIAPAAAGDDLLEVLALFLRTVAIYPDGHNRVVAVAERFVHAIAPRTQATVLEVTTTGLRVDGVDREPLGPGPKALRDALLGTGVARLTIEPATPPTSAVRFARRLQTNVRRAQAGGTAFADLWTEREPGITVTEQSFGVTSFGAGAGGETAAASARTLRADGTEAGSVEPVSPVAGAASDGASSPSSGRRPAALSSTPVARPREVAPALRDAALADDDVRAGLAQVEALLLATEGAAADGGAMGAADVLEHVLRVLPLEARLDVRRGLPLLRTVLGRLVASVDAELHGADRHDVAPSDPTAAALLRGLQQVFPDRLEDPARFAASAGASGGADRARRHEAVDDGIDDARWMGDANLSALALDPLDDAHGILDLAGLLTHALVVEPTAIRRETLRRQLVEVLRERPAFARPPCILRHLKEALALPPERRSASEVALLAGVVEEAQLGAALATDGGLDPEDVVRAFPRLLRTFVLSGGAPGFVARRVGREAVLAAHVTLLAAGGYLHGDDLVERLLGDRSVDSLPFLEVLVDTRDPSLRARVAASLRRRELPSRTAAVLRVVPDDRVPAFLLHVLCEDGFRGADSGRAESEAVGAIAGVATDRAADAGTRAYAVAALAAFPRTLAEPVVRRLVGRGLLDFSCPRAVRRAARDVIARWDAQDAVAAALAASAPPDAPAPTEGAVAAAVAVPEPLPTPGPVAVGGAVPPEPTAPPPETAVAHDVAAAFERLGIDDHLCPPTDEPGSLS